MREAAKERVKTGSLGCLHQLWGTSCFLPILLLCNHSVALSHSFASSVPCRGVSAFVLNLPPAAIPPRESSSLYRSSRKRVDLTVDMAMRSSSPSLLMMSSSSGLTDWVVENLGGDDSDNAVVSESTAGENDTLPEGGLRIGRVHILPAGAKAYDSKPVTEEEPSVEVRLLASRNGWGTGVHPTTRLCLEWLSRPDVLMGGETFLDYGCGSGILSIAALGMGAASTVGVDVEAEALVTAEKNMEFNGFAERFEGFHTREIVPFSLRRPNGVEVCVANILVGQLVRPSMVSAIVTNMAPGGWLCLSGIRPGGEVESLKRAYRDHVEWVEAHYAELSASETEGSIESYGFDVGRWARLVGRLKTDGIDVEAMSELAVS